MNRTLLFIVGGALVARYLVLPVIVASKVESTVPEFSVFGASSRDVATGLAVEKYGTAALATGAAAGFAISRFL